MQSSFQQEQPGNLSFALTRFTHLDADDFITGPPELVVEIASSTVAIDLHGKRRDYERAGVSEYLVVLPRESRAVWFVLRESCLEAASPDDDGVIRSRIFPGLWLDLPALFRRDLPGVLETLRVGLETPEHAAFVSALTAS